MTAGDADQQLEAAVERFFDGAALSIMDDERLTVDEKLHTIAYMAGERSDPPAWVADFDDHDEGV